MSHKHDNISHIPSSFYIGREAWI